MVSTRGPLFTFIFASSPSKPSHPHTLLFTGSVRKGRQPPSHSFRTSFYLFAALHVRTGLPILPQTVFRKCSFIHNHQFKCIKTKTSNSNSVILKPLGFFLQALKIWNTYGSKDNYIFFNLSLGQKAFYCCLMHHFAGLLNINTTRFVCKKKDPNIASEHRRSEAIWGFSKTFKI